MKNIKTLYGFLEKSFFVKLALYQIKDLTQFQSLNIQKIEKVQFI